MSPFDPSSSSSSTTPMYPFCNCRRPHLTREHWTNAIKTKGRTFSIPNPYYNGPESNNRRKPIVITRDNRTSTGKFTYHSSIKSTSSSFSVTNKFDLWNKIKNSFQQHLKLGRPPKNNNNIIVNNDKPRSHKKQPKSPLDQHPFLPLTKPSNGLKIYKMANPFASKTKAPVDELTLMFVEKINSPSNEYDQTRTISMVPSPISPIGPISPFSPFSPLTPISPISPISPVSTTSLPMDTTPVKVESERMDYSDDVYFVQNVANVADGGNLLDDLTFDENFNEYEFEKMISNLPDDCMDLALSVGCSTIMT